MSCLLYGHPCSCSMLLHIINIAIVMYISYHFLRCSKDNKMGQKFNIVPLNSLCSEYIFVLLCSFYLLNVEPFGTVLSVLFLYTLDTFPIFIISILSLSSNACQAEAQRLVGLGHMELFTMGFYFQTTLGVMPRNINLILHCQADAMSR